MDSSAISGQINKILQSQSFAKKNQLKKLLEVLFRNMDTPGLTPDQVIQELWPGEIRTKRASDVATEMNRLRHALKAYYEGEGASDPVIITLPNRTVPAADGTYETRWMVAAPRPSGEEKIRLTQNRRAPAKKIAFAAALIALAIATYIVVGLFTLPDQPTLFRMDGSSLIVMDKDGKELWRKAFPDGIEPAWSFSNGKRVWFADLEGKGHTSVLFSYLSASSQSRSSYLICYSDTGKEKWRWTAGRALPELAGSSPIFRTVGVGILKATSKTPLRIVAESEHLLWWPAQIALLDTSGKTVSEYWHSGSLDALLVADLDGDGRQEIIATGIANGYDHQATLIVLDPDQVSGASQEVRPEFQIHGIGVAHERLRLLFPRSDLNRALYQYNIALDPEFEKNSLRLTVGECITPLPPGCRIFYEFDKKFHLIAAFAGGDEFRSAHNTFYETGKNAHTLQPAEEAAFLKVRCLEGCKTDFAPVGKLVP